MIEVICPTCNKKITWDDKAKFRPFCSERCKLIDLGEWASEQYSIQGNDIEFPEQLESNSDYEG